MVNTRKRSKLQCPVQNEKDANVTSLLQLPEHAIEQILHHAAGLQPCDGNLSAKPEGKASPFAGCRSHVCSPDLDPWIHVVPYHTIGAPAASAGSHRLLLHRADLPAVRQLRLVCNTFRSILDYYSIAIRPTLPEPACSSASSSSRRTSKAVVPTTLTRTTSSSSGSNTGITFRHFPRTAALDLRNITNPHQLQQLLNAAATHLTQLQDLWTPLHNPSVSSLASLTSLKALTLDGWHYTGPPRQLAAAVSPLSKVEALMLHGLKPQGRQLVPALAGLPSLSCLGISYSSRPAAGLDTWSGCSHLTLLSVANVGLTSLASMTQMTNLQQLHLLNNERPLQLLPSHTSALTSLSILEIHIAESLCGLDCALSCLVSLRELLLPGCSLTDLPASLASCSLLERIDLRGNKLQGFPQQLLQLPQVGNLRALDISHNVSVYTLPESVSRLVGLTYLGLANINLVELPAAVTGLAELQRLNISFNVLPKLPEGMGQLKRLRQLSMLGCFEEFSPLLLMDQLQHMTGLQELVAGHNSIPCIKQCIRKLTALTRLDLHSSGVVVLHPALGELTLLEELLLSGNHILSLPCSIGKLRALRVLYVAENRLSTVPEAVGQLSALVELDVSGNPLESLPERLWGLAAGVGVEGGEGQGEGGQLERVYVSKGLKGGGLVPAVLPPRLQVVWS